MKMQKKIVLILIFLLLLLVSFNYFGKDRILFHLPLAQKFRDIHVNYINTISTVRSSPAAAYCNFPSASDFTDSQEGKPPSSDWILQQVQVVIRHGDRSPMKLNLYKRLGVIPKYCNVLPDTEPFHPLLHDFLSTMKADYEIIPRGSRLPGHPFPNSDVCRNARLSQLGVVQHLQNGLILRKAYVENLNLLKDTPQGLTKKVFAISTVTPRTTQSVIAFLYGLIPQFHLDKVKIHYSYSDLFRGKGCPASKRMEGSIDKFRNHIYETRQRTNTTFRKLSDMFELGDHSGVLIDSLLNGFLCKKFKLPCADSKCVTVEDLDVLVNEEEFLMRETAQQTSFPHQSMLNMQPLLSKIVKSMTEKVKDKESVDLLVYSGHDTTLKPLIRTLGIKEFSWPRLGTRLVFELWMDGPTKQHYIRVLLNGKNYSSHLHCYNHDTDFVAADSCTFESFQSFVTTEILHHFGAKTIEEACV